MCTQGLNPMVEQFLDARSIADKLDLLYLMRESVSVKDLSICASSLDIIPEAETGTETEIKDALYDSIRSVLQTKKRYELERR